MRLFRLLVLALIPQHARQMLASVSGCSLSITILYSPSSCRCPSTASLYLPSFLSTDARLFKHHLPQSECLLMYLFRLLVLCPDHSALSPRLFMLIRASLSPRWGPASSLYSCSDCRGPSLLDVFQYFVPCVLFGRSSPAGRSILGELPSPEFHRKVGLRARLSYRDRIVPASRRLAPSMARDRRLDRMLAT